MAPLVAVCYDMMVSTPSPLHLVGLLVTFMIAFVGIADVTGT